MPILETERLLLREATPEDAPFFYELMNTTGWLTHIGDRGITNTAAASFYVKQRLQASYRKLGFGLWVMEIKESGIPMGLCGFVQRDYLPAPDIGFAILPKYERKGFTFEAAVACLNFGKEKLGLRTVFGITSIENAASQQLLCKLGLSFTEKRLEAEEELMIYQLKI